MGASAVLAMPTAAVLLPALNPLASLTLLGLGLVGAGILLFVAGARPAFRFEVPPDRGGAR